jgi:hypothetical protein
LERLIGVGRLASASWQRDSILPSGRFSGARLHTERNLLPSRELETDQS